MRVAEPDITIRLGRTKNLLSRAAIKRLIQESARAVRVKGSYAVSISFIDAPAIRKLNRSYRGNDKPTNVLAFCAQGASLPVRQAGALDGESVPDADLGDIFLCGSVIRKEAPEFMMTSKRHAAQLVVHGFLHLVGYGHVRDRDAKLMERLEKKILQATL